MFDTLRQTLAQYIEEFKQFAQIVAELDVYESLALVALKHGYTKPVVDDSTEL